MPMSCHKRGPPQISSLTASVLSPDCSLTYRRYIKKEVLFSYPVLNIVGTHRCIFYFHFLQHELNFGLAFDWSWNASDKRRCVAHPEHDLIVLAALDLFWCGRLAFKVHFWLFIRMHASLKDDTHTTSKHNVQTYVPYLVIKEFNSYFSLRLWQCYFNSQC